MTSFANLELHGVPEAQVALLEHHLEEFPAIVTDPLRALYWLIELLPWERQLVLARRWVWRALETGELRHEPRATVALLALRADPNSRKLEELLRALKPTLKKVCADLPRAPERYFLLVPGATPRQGGWLALHHALRAALLASRSERLSAAACDARGPGETVASDLWHVFMWRMLVLPRDAQALELDRDIREAVGVVADWLGTWVRGVEWPSG